MVHLRLLRQLVILSMVFNICTPKCRLAERGFTQLRCTSYYDCEWNKRVTPSIYKCVNSTITEIYQNVKVSLNSENKIYVSDSNIAAVEPNSGSWNRTTEFYLDHTNTSQIVPQFFETFDNLEVLEITNNQLKEIDDVFNSSFPSLLKLNLSSNSIETLPPYSFSGLSMLKTLDLSKNKISTISKEVFSYQPFLQQVNLSQNLLKDADNLFSENVFLKGINLSKNLLTDFNFFHLKYHNNLRHLDLSQNLLKTVTNSSLINMNSEDDLDDFSYYRIRHLTDLRTTLNISHNFLKTISENFCNSKIQELDLSYNQISEISPYSFQNGTHLAYLHLQHNNLKVLPIETFTNVTNLVYLDLSFNSISKIPFGLFNSLNVLIYLDLSENNMILDFHTLSTLGSLDILKLQNNTIKNLDPEILVQRLQYLSYVSLGDNVWNCSTLAHMIHTLKRKGTSVFNGNNIKTSNILGYTCTDNKDQNEEDIIFERDNEISSQKEISMQKFFDEDFKNSAFYRFFANFAQQPQNNSFVTNDVDKNAFIQYLNENFTETKFYKYLENMKGFKNKSSEEIYTDENTSIIQKEMSQNVKSLLIAQNATLNKFADILNRLKPEFTHQALTDQLVKNDNKPYQGSLIMSNILLILILISVLGITYYVLRKLKRNEFTTNEHVQLM